MPNESICTNPAAILNNMLQSSSDSEQWAAIEINENRSGIDANRFGIDIYHFNMLLRITENHCQIDLNHC
jgi:hypothetical protein